MPTKNIPTGYANSKRRVIFTSAAGKPYARTPAGKKVYQPKAKFVMNNNGSSTRVIKKANLNSVPSAIRPKRAPAKTSAKKPGNVFKAVKKAASPSKRSPAKTVRKTVRKAPARKAPVRKAPVRKAPKRKPNSVVKRSMTIVKRVARKPVSASLKAGQDFAKMMNRLTAKPRKMAMNTVKKVAGGNNKPKARKNKGVGRALVASPGGTLYKGRAALTRRQKANIKKNAISIANSIKKMLK